MKKTPGLQMPAPIFNRRRPRQALFAHPNSQEETSSESWMKYGQSSTYQSNHMPSYTLDQPHQISVSCYGNQSASTSQEAHVSGGRTVSNRGHQSSSDANPTQYTGYKFAPGNEPMDSRTPTILSSHTATNQKQGFSSFVASTQYQPKTYRGDCTNSENVYCSFASSSQYPRDKENVTYGKDKRSSIHHSNQMKSRHEKNPPKRLKDLKHESNARGHSAEQKSSKQRSASLGRLTSTRDKSAVAETRSSVMTDSSLHFITATIQGMKHWSKFSHKLQMLFEIFGTLNSAISFTAGRDYLHFMIKDDIDSVPCIFYEIDRKLTRLVRAQWHRCVGTFNENTKTFHCVSVRAAEQAEIKLYRNQVNICDKTLRILVSKIAET